MPIFALLSASPRVTLPDLRKIAKMVTTQQHRDLGPDWQVSPWSAVAVTDEKIAPKGSMLVRYVEKDDSTPDAAAWHSETSEGAVILEVVVSAILENGGTILKGSNSVASATSHECCEARVNPNLTRYYLSGDGTRLLVGEVSDPVQGIDYDIGGVSASDYVRPAYFDPETSASAADLSKSGLVLAPFGLTPGGYQSWAFPDIDPDSGLPFLNVTQIFGEEVPDWQAAAKRASAKTAELSRRLARARATPVPTLPGRPMEGDDDPSRRATTLVPCCACGGNFRTVAATGAPAPRGASKSYRVVRCPWCTSGCMTEEQVKAWKRFKENPPLPR